MKHLWLFLVCFFIIQTNGFQEKNCGPELTKALWIICRGGFNRLPIGKRTAHSRYILPAIESKIRYPYFYNSISDIFALEQENFAEQSRRARMLGIVDECCLKSCSIEELSTYCAR